MISRASVGMNTLHIDGTMQNCWTVLGLLGSFSYTVCPIKKIKKNKTIEFMDIEFFSPVSMCLGRL